MTNNRDHYVPQFYMRNFSRDEKSIGMFNIDSRKFVKQASIRGQCFKKGFHDYHPGLEKAFGIVEGAASKIIRRMISDDIVPEIASDDHAFLLFFIATQRARTLKSGNSHNASTDRMFKTIYEETIKAEGIDVSQYTVGYDNSIAIPLSAAADKFHVMGDLRIHLFLNKTNEEFITSDNPVVVHNQFCEGITWQGVLGWACSGIQILLPLSPRHLLFLYDSGVYNVTSNKKPNTKVITSLAEVKCFNSFQIINADKNVYFLSESMKDVVTWQVTHLADKRKVKRLILVQTERVQSGEELSELIHFYEKLLPYNMRLSSVRIKNPYREIPLRRRANMYRHREGFDEFADDHPPRAQCYAVRRSFAD
jgi:hypothetical protein